jgi:energy-coupling factor transport system substrate-specific component
MIFINRTHVQNKQSDTTGFIDPMADWLAAPPAAAAPAHGLQQGYWLPRELVVIGVFAAMIKIVSLMVALSGGGMNPLSLVMKNALATALLIVLLYKVPKFGVMTLYGVISSIISLLLTGSSLMTLPGTLLTCALCDGLLRLTRGYRKPLFLIFGVALYDLLSRSVSLGVSFLVFRESPAVFFVMVGIVAVGYGGCLLGIGGGIYFVRELKHAGIIRA